MNSIILKKNYFCNWGKPAKQHFVDLLVQSNNGIISLSYDTVIVIMTALMLTKKHFDRTWQLSTFLDCWFFYITFFFSLSIAEVIITLKKRKHNWNYFTFVFCFGLCFHCLFNHLLPIFLSNFIRIALQRNPFLPAAGVTNTVGSNSARAALPFSESSGADSFCCQLPPSPCYAHAAKGGCRQAVSATGPWNSPFYTGYELK